MGPPLTSFGQEDLLQKRPLPSGILTCWDINTGAASDAQVISCSPCELFCQEKVLLSHLRVLSTNKNITEPSKVPIRHRCDTPWTASSTQQKRRSPQTPPPAASLPNVDISSPNKKARTSVGPNSDPPGLSASATFCLPCVSPPTSTDPSDSFTSYLLDRIAIQNESIRLQTKAMTELGIKNKP
jgi:hypothetical protein